MVDRVQPGKVGFFYLVVFAEAALPLMVPGFKSFPYIALVMARLQIALGGGGLVINVAPRHLKSFMLLCTIAWFMGRHPDKEVMLIAHSQPLATDLAGKLRALMESPLFRELFPDFQIVAGRSGISDFRTDRNGGFLAASFDTAITGRGGHAIFIDDAHAAHNVHSDTARQKVLDTFDNTLKSRLNDDTGPIIMMAHRLHAEDLSEHLVTRRKFDQLVLAYQATGPERFEYGGVSFTREKGDLLQPGRTSLPQELLIPEHVFLTQYQQSPVAMQAGVLKLSHFKPVDAPPEGGQYVVSWDLASSATPDEHRSYSVALVFQVMRDVAYLRHIVREQADYATIKRRAFDLHDKFRPTHHLIEEASLGHSLISDLRNYEANALGMPHGGRSKLDRLEEVLHKLEMDYVRTVRDTGGIQDFINECLSFPNGRHDDQVDALTQFLRWVTTRGPDAQIDRAIIRVGQHYAPNTRRGIIANIKKMVS